MLSALTREASTRASSSSPPSSPSSHPPSTCPHPTAGSRPTCASAFPYQVRDSVQMQKGIQSSNLLRFVIFWGPLSVFQTIIPTHGIPRGRWPLSSRGCLVSCWRSRRRWEAWKRQTPRNADSPPLATGSLFLWHLLSIFTLVQYNCNQSFRERASHYTRSRTHHFLGALRGKSQCDRGNNQFNRIQSTRPHLLWALSRAGGRLEGDTRED